MYSSPGTAGPHSYTVYLGPIYPWHAVRLLTGEGIYTCDTTGEGILGIMLPENKQVTDDAHATSTTNYFSTAEVGTVEDREHVEVLAYTGGSFAKYTPVMTDGLGRMIEYAFSAAEVDCGFSLEASVGVDRLVRIHLHPGGSGAEWEASLR